MNDLATITERLENAKNINIEKDEIIKSEALKLQRAIQNVNIKAESQRNNLNNETLVKNEIITSLQKDLEESNQKYESLLSQNKKGLLDKDKDIANIMNNLNSMNAEGKN